MKRYIVSTLFLFTLSTVSIAQSRCDCYERLFNLGKYYDNHEHFEQALGAFKDALNFMEPSQESHEIYQYIAWDYNELKNYDSGAVYAAKAIALGIRASNFKEKTPELYARIPAPAKKEWPEGVDVDWMLYNKVQGIHKTDQLMRNSYDTYFDAQWLPDSLHQYKKPVEHALAALLDSVSYLHTMAVLEIYKGIPTFKKVGFPYALNNYVIIHVVRYPVMGKHLLDKLKQLNSNCEPISKRDILFFEDVRKTSLEYDYATQKAGKSFAGLYGYDRYNNIEDLKKVDSIRFAHNLYRLQEDVIAPDTLPKGYVPAPYPKNYFCLEKYQIR